MDIRRSFRVLHLAGSTVSGSDATAICRPGWIVIERTAKSRSRDVWL